jgi:undecaprenyl-diphosphatase
MPVARFVRSFDVAEVNRLGDAIAVLGQGLVIGVTFVLIGLLGWGLKREYLKELGLRGLVALLGSAAMTQLLKHLIGRPRPRFAHADEFMLGPSLDSGLDAFPSGHTFNAFGAATVAAWYAPVLRAPLFLAAGLVGLSRIVRGSHFPTDVFAGAVLGVLVGSLAAAGYKRWREETLPGLVRTGAPLVVFGLLVLWVALHPVPGWPQEIGTIGAGVVLVLAGGLVRGLAVGYKRGTLILGVAVASGPWWAGPLMLLALLPTALAGPRQDTAAAMTSWPFWTSLSVRGRESLDVGVALLAIAALRAVKGLLPLG